MDLVANHLQICEGCRHALERIEPFGFVHSTPDGAIYAKITRLGTGRWFARHWSGHVSDGRESITMAGAKRYLTESFSRTFPDHKCGTQCIS
jgi:hypothetical protein